MRNIVCIHNTWFFFSFCAYAVCRVSSTDSAGHHHLIQGNNLIIINATSYSLHEYEYCMLHFIHDAYYYAFQLILSPNLYYVLPSPRPHNTRHKHLALLLRNRSSHMEPISDGCERESTYYQPPDMWLPFSHRRSFASATFPTSLFPPSVGC